MLKIKAFIDRNALVLAMLIGAVGYPWFRHLTWLLPPLIFMMLFFTFCKVNPLDLRLHAWHWIVLGLQMVLTGAVYYGLLYGLNAVADRWRIAQNDIAIITQGIMICIIMPTATAAPIIAGKLGGSIQNLTTFTLLSNVATAIVVPAFFPIVNPTSGIHFVEASWLILCKVAPLLLGPFVAAWLLRLGYNGWQKHKGTGKTFSLSRTWAAMPFYLWAATLILLMADLTYTLVTQQYNWWTVLALCVGALVTFWMQFLIGRQVGYHFPAPNRGEDYHDVLINPEAAHYTMPQVSRITAGQAFGQKNTTLGVWMAQTYLQPMAAIGPAAYILVQNIINNMQLVIAAKRKDGK